MLIVGPRRRDMRGRMLATWAGLRVESREVVGEVVDKREGRETEEFEK